MAPRAGRLAVKLHRAKSVHGEAQEDSLKQPDAQLYSVVEVEEYGRLATAPSDEASWEQELTMEIGPQASRLKLCLYQVDRSSQGHQLLAQGSFHLDSLFSDDEPESLEHVRIPLVNHVGKAAAELDCSMRFFHARTPGKFRDPLGKEYIDDSVLSGGPREGPRKVNSLSPVSSPRFASSQPRTPVQAHAHPVNAASP